MNASHSGGNVPFNDGTNNGAPADHFDEMTGLLFLEDQLDAIRAREVSIHLEGCASCRRLFQVLQNENVWLRQALCADDEAIPARLLSPQLVRNSWSSWGWAAALAFGLAGAYTFWAGVVQPWLEQAGQAGFSQDSLLTMLFFTSALWKGWDAMRAMMELLAVATLAVLGIWLLRRQFRRVTAVAFVVAALGLVLAFSPSAGATEIHRGDPNYTLPAGQQTPSDLIVTANYTRIDGDVNGDLIVFSDSVTVNGHVKGDILVFSQELRLNGTVDGNLRGACHSLVLNGSVAKNASVFTQNLDMDGKAVIGGSLIAVSGDTELDGRIGGDLLAFGDSFTIDGSAGHDARIRAQRLTIGSNAEIKGSTTYSGSRQPDVSSGAKLASPIEATIGRPGPNYSSPRFYWHQVLFWGIAFVFGLMTLLLAPGFFFDVAAASKRIGPSMGWGALVLIVTPIAAIISCLTIVGVGVGIFALLWYLIALYASQIYVGAWLGETMLGWSAGVGAAVGRLALGLAVIRLAMIVPLVGLLVHFVVIIWGMGAVAMAVQRRMRHPVAAQPAPATA
jgi:cytoskeletal protein CcmA (bactofilin family)